MSLLARLIETGTDPIELLLAGVALLIAVGLVLAFIVISARQNRQRSRRIARATARSARPGTATVSMRRQTAYSTVPVLDQLIRLLPNVGKLRDRLARTGYKLTIGRYLALCAAVGTIVMAGLWLAFRMPLAPTLLIGLVMGLGLPHVIVSHLGARRVKRFTALFPEAIDLIVRGLKSGLPVTESIKIVGQEIKDPVGEEFRLISDSIKFGMSLNQALWSAAPRISTPEFRFFNITLSIQQETGGNLAETLENLGSVVRRRRQMVLKIKAFSSEAKASAYIIGSLPFIMFFLIMMMNYEYAMMLFTDRRGVLMVLAGFGSYAMGVGVMAKMIRFDI
jgi:tight adherence protein B